MTNAEAVRRYIDEANNGGDLGVFDELVAQGFTGHFGWAPDRAALRAFVEWQRRTAPDWHIEILDVVADGDLVAVRAHARGTRTESAPGVPTEPRHREVDWFTLYRLEGGRIAEAWPYVAPAP